MLSLLLLQEPPTRCPSPPTLVLLKPPDGVSSAQGHLEGQEIVDLA